MNLKVRCASLICSAKTYNDLSDSENPSSVVPTQFDFLLSRHDFRLALFSESLDDIQSGRDRFETFVYGGSLFENIPQQRFVTWGPIGVRQGVVRIAKEIRRN